MSTELAAEALVAVVGLWPKKPPDVNALMAAEGLAPKWAARVKRWLRAPQQPATYEAPPAQSDLQARILAPVDQTQMTGWLTALGDHDIGTSFVAVIQRGREYLDAQWPKYSLDNVVPDALPLSTDDYGDVWALTRTLDDPGVLLDDLAAWCLLPAQVAAMAAVYPELTTMLREILNQELVDHVTRERPLTWQQEDLIRIVRGLAPEAQIEIPQDSGAAPRAPEKTFEIDFKATRTPSERIQSP
jgi:hypothetical protein